MENNKSIKGGREIMRLYAIDILRGIAAFGIVGCHLMLSPRTNAGSWVTHFCDMNVAVFAVLAGCFTYVHNEWGGGMAYYKAPVSAPLAALLLLVPCFSRGEFYV